ncbi:flagellar protein FlaG [Peribacillus kribbensis]|uniref:flagellar protein FlaG n=1 Tax=Peribacillus kribbensis TaxID=356658 RepID=UPI000413EA4F|nr:flagellar protein FlaG [Peribacillus kribbensis]
MIERLSINLSPTSPRPAEFNGKESSQVNQEQLTVLDRNQDKEEITKEKLNHMVDSVNQFLNHTALKFEFHEKLHEYYVTIVDSETNELIKEIPPKKMLDVFAQMEQFLGIIIDKKI